MRRTLIFFLVVHLAGCSFPSYRTPFSVRNPLTQGVLSEEGKDSHTYLSEKAQAFIDAYREAKKTENPATLKKYIGTGVTYAHLLCKDYFDRLTFTKAHRDFAKRETNLAAGLTSAVMGLAKASSASVAGVGALFSFGEASFDSYDESFIVSPDIYDLERLVKEKQKEEEAVIYKKMASQNPWPDGIETLDQAERTLSGYIHYCTVNGIRILLNASVQAKTKEIAENTPAIQQSNEKPSELKQK